MRYVMAMAVMLAAWTGAGPATAQERDDVIGLAAGSDTSTHMQIARDIARVAAGRIDIAVSPGGSLLNIDRIRLDRAFQFAIVQHDALVYKALLDPAVQNGVRVIFPLYDEEIHILARRDAGIETLQDLQAKRVNIGPEETGSWITGQIIRALEELDWRESYRLPQDALLALLEGQIDAMIYTVGQPWGLGQEMDASFADTVKLLDFHSPELAPYFPTATIPAGTYPWQQEAVNLHATQAILVTYNFFPGAGRPPRFQHYYDTIYELIAVVSENLETLRATGHPKWREIDPLDLSKVNWTPHQQAEKAIADLRPAVTEAVITKTQICTMFGTC